MTKPRLPQGRAAGSQEHGDASSPFVGDSGYSWIVNFNNGNSNDLHHNNEAFVRPVRSAPAAGAGEYQGAAAAVTLRELFDAWQRARCHKKPSRGQLAFDARWIDGLIALQECLNSGNWEPAPTACFIATRPKAREIHAPAFSDRIVHHWLVPRLEQIFEPAFAFDSYANRKGKGTHAAVDRVRDHARQVHSGQGGGFYLQLDIHNFFYSIHRPTLWSIIKRRLEQHGAPPNVLQVAHALLRHAPTRPGVRHLSTAEQRALVPAHKRLEHAGSGCGLPIGNLSSQFFANCCLNELDQFVKRRLGIRRYVRYVDDFILVHRDREQLDAWRIEIESFLSQRLRLSLKPDIRLAPLTAGIDFLGYVVYPTHTLVRQRVIQHAREALWKWQQAHVTSLVVQATPAEYRQLQSIWGSYVGHFRQANWARLEADFYRRFPWLHVAADVGRSFDVALEGELVQIHPH